MTDISQKQLQKILTQKNPPVVVDVRSKIEFQAGHIPQAVHLPFYSVFWNKKRLPADKAKPLVLTCEHGPRAVMARKLLAWAGYHNVRLLSGHMTAWKKNGLPTETGYQ